MISHLTDFAHVSGCPEKSRLERCGGSNFPELKVFAACGASDGELVTDSPSCPRCHALSLGRQMGMWRPSVIASSYVFFDGLNVVFRTLKTYDGIPL